MSRRSCSPRRSLVRDRQNRPRVASRAGKCDCDNNDCEFFHRGQIHYRHLRNYNGDMYLAIKCEDHNCGGSRYCGRYHGTHRNPTICIKKLCSDQSCKYAHWERDEDLHRYFKLKRDDRRPKPKQDVTVKFDDRHSSIRRLEDLLISDNRINPVDTINPQPIFNLSFDNKPKQESVIVTRLVMKNEDVSPEELRAAEIEKREQLQTLRNLLIQGRESHRINISQKIYELLKIKSSLVDISRTIPFEEDIIQNVFQNTLSCVNKRISKLMNHSPPPGFANSN